MMPSRASPQQYWERENNNRSTDFEKRKSCHTRGCVFEVHVRVVCMQQVLCTVRLDAVLEACSAATSSTLSSEFAKHVSMNNPESAATIARARACASTQVGWMDRCAVLSPAVRDSLRELCIAEQLATRPVGIPPHQAPRSRIGLIGWDVSCVKPPGLET